MAEPESEPSHGARRALVALHAEVDAAAAEVAARNAGRLQCGRGCAACCVDDLTVFEVEAERIRSAHPELLAHGAPHPAGACAFLDAAGACRVYADRPYVCRTQGLPLRWIQQRANGEVAELRDICELNLEGAPLPDLPEQDCWLLGPFEARLAEIQRGSDGGESRRIALRALFARGGDAAPRLSSAPAEDLES